MCLAKPLFSVTRLGESGWADEDIRCHCEHSQPHSDTAYVKIKSHIAFFALEVFGNEPVDKMQCDYSTTILI